MERREFLKAGVAGAALVLVGPGLARAETFINVLTGGTSGVYYPLGVALATLFNEKIEGAPTPPRRRPRRRSRT